MSFLRSLYEVVTLPVSLLLGPLFMLRARGRARLWERYGEWRLGFETREIIWFHGASFGEINGLLPVIREVKKRFPTHALLVSATSVTGPQRAEGVADHVRLLPFDNPLWISRALRGLKIKALILGETEIWPGLLHDMHSRGVPICIVNGIVSDYTFSSYQSMRPLIGENIASLSLVLAADDKSAGRYVSLGARPEVVRTSGNSKYDLHPSVETREEALKLRQRFFDNERPVLVLGSLRPGEEAVWFEALRDYAVSGQSVGHCPFNVIVAPRHREKFDYFSQKLEQYDLVHKRWSRTETQQFFPPEADSIVLLDAMGMLEKVYSFADLVFVGGTLADFGGHNPLEPAAYGACLVIGPHTSKIAEIVQTLQQRDALLRVRDSKDARDVIESLIENRRELQAKGERAREVWQEYAGAAGRIAEELSKLISAV